MLVLAVFSALLTTAVQASPPASPPEEGKRPLPQIGVEAVLIELDVVVTDGKDRPVTSLGPEDFEILEDGQPHPITHFARGFDSASWSPPAASGPTASPAPFPDEGTPRGRYLVLAVDDYHLEQPDLAPVREALLRFIDSQLQSGDQALVAAASGGLGALQQFTTDREVLRRAVAKLRAQNRSFRAPLDVPYVTDYQAQLIEAGDQEALALAVDEIMATEPLSRQTGTNRTRVEQQVQGLARQVSTQTAYVTSLTLSSLERLLRALSALRGRKVVALFSNGFLLGSDRQSSRRDLQTIADAAARSGVVLYTIDARGLVATLAIGDARVGGGYDITSHPGVRERIELQGSEAARDGLNALALDTGGLALFDRNDLGGALQRVLEDSATYYRLGFEPQEAPGDGRFHKLEVRVRSRSGLRVRTASGYFARQAEGVAAARAATRQRPATPEDSARMLRAALDSSFPVRGLPVDLAADYVVTKEGDVLVATACLDLARLRFRPASDGREQAALEIVGVVVDESGKTVAQLSDRVELSLTAEAKERAFANGLTYRKALAVRPGLLQARMAVREDESGLLGSASQWVEVPDRTRQPLALSSVVIGAEDAVPLTTARGWVSFDRPRHAEVAHRFARGGHLDYVVVVYDRQKAGGPAGEVVMEKQVLSGSKVLTQSAPSPLPVEGPEGTRAEGGRLHLDAFAPGDYELRLVVTDRTTRATATRSVKFTVE